MTWIMIKNLRSCVLVCAFPIDKKTKGRGNHQGRWSLFARLNTPKRHFLLSSPDSLPHPRLSFRSVP